MKGLGPWLDSMSYKTYLEDKLGLNPGVTKHLDPILAIPCTLKALEELLIDPIPSGINTNKLSIG